MEADTQMRYRGLTFQGKDIFAVKIVHFDEEFYFVVWINQFHILRHRTSRKAPQTPEFLVISFVS